MFDWFNSVVYKPKTNKEKHKKVLKHLEQGKKLLQNRTQIASNEQPRVEGFTPEIPKSIQKELDALEKIYDEYHVSINQLYELESEYEQDLQEYAKRMSTDIAGKNIKIGETIYYITIYGYAREYGDKNGDVWLNHDKTCGGEPIEQDKPLSHLQVIKGKPMNKNSVCGYEGQNVKYNDKIAYVSMGGEVYLYQKPYKPGDIIGCPSATTNVDKETWNKLMSDKVGDATQSLRCYINRIRPDLIEAMLAKQKEVNKNSKIIQILIDRQIRPQLDKMNNITKEKRDTLEKYMNELSKATSQSYHVPATLDAMSQNAGIYQRQQFLYYIAYIILFVVGIGALYYFGSLLGGITGKAVQSVQNVGNSISGQIKRGAPRQSQLLREMKSKTNVFGDIRQEI